MANTRSEKIKESAVNRYDFLGSSKIGRLIKSYDWSKTSLGPIEQWPQSLRTAVNIALQSPVPIVMLWNKDGVMIYNDAYSEFAGARHPKLLGSKVLEGWPEVADFNRNVMDKGLKGKKLSYKDQELTLHRNNKPEQVWLDLNYSPVLGENNKPAGVLAIVVETTEQVLARKQVEKSENLLKNILESMGDAFFILDKNFRFVMVNKTQEKLSKTKRKDTLGKIFWEVFPATTNPGSKYWSEYHKVVKTKKPVHFVDIYEPLDLWTEVDAYPTEQGGISVFFRDVSDRERAISKLKYSEERFRVVADNATTGLFVMDDRQYCTYMNPAAEKITGYNLKQILDANKPLHDIVHHTRPNGKPYPIDECPIDRALPEKSNIPGEDIFVRPDGSFYPVAFMASPIIKDDTPVGTIIEVRDITGQKHAENELRELIAITEQRNALIKINKAKDEFIGLASHQLRTPATAVKQYIGILLDHFAGKLTPEQTRYLQIAYDSNERELAIISDLLKTAQINSAQYNLQKKPSDVSKLINKCITDLQPALEIRKQTISISKPPEPVKVLLDKTEMKLVFMNLLENASKYSHPGSEIKVSIKPGKKNVTVKVMDKGVGIAKTNQQRIFEKFTRIDNELSDTVAGTGLGLFWVKQIVELHNGSIKLDSSLGSGSTFTVKLPL